jgi:outer membrane protein TolC
MAVNKAEAQRKQDLRSNVVLFWKLVGTGIGLFALLFLLTSTVSAQDVRTITLQEAINIALENNFQLKQAENNLKLSNESIKSEYADFAPSVTSSFSGSRSTGQQFIADRLSEPGLNPFVDVTSQSISGRLSASITIFDGFNNINSLRAIVSCLIIFFCLFFIWGFWCIWGPPGAGNKSHTSEYGPPPL